MSYKKGLMREYFSVTLSRLAYITDFKTLERELKKIGFDMDGEKAMFSYDEMDGFVAVCKEGQVIVFRGSEWEKNNNYQDWRINADFKLINIEIESVTIKNVARGYAKRIEKYWDKLKELIWDDDILVSGHSAGGGYTTIMAKAIKEGLHKKVRPFPHATPRVCNTHHFLPESFYTINSADIVTRLPLRLMQRRHTGTLIYFNRRGKYIKKAKIEKLINFLFSIKKDIKDIGNDHQIQEYETNWFKNWDKIQETIIEKRSL